VALGVALAPILLAGTPSVPVCIYDLDNSPQSQSVIETIVTKSEGIEIVDMDIESARKALETGAVEVIFEIKQGFGEKLTNGEYEDLINMQLSKYSRGGRTISDAVAAAVMDEYSKCIAYNTVFEHTGDAQLADTTANNARSSDLTLIIFSETGRTSAQKDTGVNNSILYLSAIICAFGVCFSSVNNSAVSQRLASEGKNYGLITMINNFGKLLPFMLLFLIPVIIGNENIFYLCVLALIYTVTVCALSALISNIPLTLRLNIAVIYSLINAIFTLSALFESPIARLFPGHILSTGLKNIDIASVFWLLLLLCLFGIPAIIYKPEDKK